MLEGLRCTWQHLMLAVLALIVTGCAGRGGQAAQSTTVTRSPNQAFVTSVQPDVVRSRPGSSAQSLPPGDTADLQPKDQVSVRGKGRAFLEFPEHVEVELVRGSSVHVDNLQAGPSGPVVVSLKQLEGHTFTQIQGHQRVQVAVATDYATARPLSDNAQFLVCQAPGALTCIVAVNGATEVEAQNSTVTLNTGQGTFVTPGQPPHTPFCADMDQVRDWWSKMRGTEDVSDLSSMVVAWMQRPCPTGTPAKGAAAAPSSPAAGAAAKPAPSAVPTLFATVATPATPTAPPPTLTAAPTATPTALPAPTASPTAVPTTPGVTATEPATATRTPAPAAAATAAPTYGPSLPATAPSTARLPSSNGMVQIPVGTYVVGSSPDDYHLAAQKLQLPGFWIDKYEVTNAQYKTFVDSTGHAAPVGWRGGTFPAGHAQHPVLGLTWADAVAFCNWAGKRLPAEAEWEVAGRGPAADPPLYPWGSDPSAGGQSFNLSQSDTYEVGTVAFNRSVFGVYDLIGTVWQWVGEPYGPVPPDTHILRGGRYGLLQDLAYRQPAGSNDARFVRVAGVRCAADRVQE